MLKRAMSRLPKALINLSTSSHSGSKASALLVLLMSVFISSGIFVGSVHAPTPGVNLTPNVGYCNPLANSGLLPFASGSDYSVTFWTQGAREAAVYGGNGNEPISTTTAQGSACAEQISNDGWEDWNIVSDSNAQIIWPYMIMKDDTRLSSTSATGPIPLQLNYSMSLCPLGNDALAYGWIQISYGNIAIDRTRGEGIGSLSSSTGGDPAVGQISWSCSFAFPSVNYFTLTVYTRALAIAWARGDLGQPYAWSEVQTAARAYLCIDPSSPLASQLQIYAGKNYTADPNDPSQWTPAVPTPINFGTIIPASSGTEGLVVRGLDNRIYCRRQTGAAWQDWNVLPGSTIDRPAAAMIGNQLHIVVRGSDSSTLWYGCLTNASDPTSFSNWARLDGATSSAPTLTSNGTMLCLAVRGLDNRVYYRCYNGSWAPWHAVPTGATLDSPAAAMLGNQLHVVVRGMDGNSLWDTIVNCSGTVIRNWRRLSGATALKPVLASSQGLNETYLVVTGLDKRIYYMNYSGSTGSWGSWSALPTGATLDGPAATVMGSMLCTVVRGMDGSALWCGDVDWGTSSFTGWTKLSGATPSAPTLTS